MIYVTTCCWLLVVILLAGGVQHVWTRMAKHRTIDAVLLPGTLIARLGRIVALLITGAKLNNKGGGDGKQGNGGGQPQTEPKLPFIGPMLVSLVPLAALTAVCYFLAAAIGADILRQVPADRVAQVLPTSLSGFWAQLRDLISLAEATLNALLHVENPSWRVVFFCYILTSMAVRMAPLPGNIRGHVGAIIAGGILSALAGTVVPGLPERIVGLWPILALLVGWMLILMIITLIIRGIISSIRLMMQLDVD